MQIDVDANKIVAHAITKLVEENIVTDVLENSEIREIIERTLENEDVKKQIEEMVITVANEYLDSEEGREYIIEEVKGAISSDIISDDRIVDIVANFLDASLKMQITTP